MRYDSQLPLKCHPHTPSTSFPTIPQPSYTSVSTRTTPPVVCQPSYTSISTQTEPLTEIFEIATPVPPAIQPPPTPTPTPTSCLGPIPPPPPPLLPTSFLTPVSEPISESPLGSTTFSRPQASSNRLATLQPRPYPPSQSRPEPEPPPIHGPTSQVH
ncbi:hypothetical protein BYT27DRAFT_7249266 [Phlegmacium glaucopus]|nr:hypothetical protein BYT27DRAFT_7249266 [Phlegmacium glaucopus]